MTGVSSPILLIVDLHSDVVILESLRVTKFNSRLDEPPKALCKLALKLSFLFTAFGGFPFGFLFSFLDFSFLGSFYRITLL